MWICERDWKGQAQRQEVGASLLGFEMIDARVWTYLRVRFAVIGGNWYLPRAGLRVSRYCDDIFILIYLVADGLAGD